MPYIVLDEADSLVGQDSFKVGVQLFHGLPQGSASTSRLQASLSAGQNDL